MIVLCVGGPLHGKRWSANAPTRQHFTHGGPEAEGFVAHVYDLRKSMDGRLFYRWRMVRRWARAGFVKPAWEIFR